MPEDHVNLDALSFEPLTPVSYLDRAAAAHGDRTAVVDGERRWTYAQLHERCRRRPVAVLAPYTHVLREKAGAGAERRIQ